jgi:hypothetical protein
VCVRVCACSCVHACVCVLVAFLSVLFLPSSSVCLMTHSTIQMGLEIEEIEEEEVDAALGNGGLGRLAGALCCGVCVCVCVCIGAHRVCPREAHPHKITPCHADTARQHAFWTRWRRWSCLRTAMACATSMASSRSASVTACRRVTVTVPHQIHAITLLSKI